MADGNEIDLKRLDLERARYKSEIVKWIIAAIGVTVSFYVIDVGKLKLEDQKARNENQRSMLLAYLSATEAVQPDVWKRKLRVLATFSDDSSIREWAGVELKNIEDFAAKDAIYRETLRIASLLVSRTSSVQPAGTSERQVARARFEQLYWADLPFVREDNAVETEMVNYRNSLLAAEGNPANADLWENVNRSLIRLSKVLRDSLPTSPR
jgi:hypothetical protein